MALRQNLTKPLVVEPLSGHTHTVIFLHRLPANTDDKDLRSKVLSTKRTKDGKTLRFQFPAVRWVFPYAKLHLQPDGTPSMNNKHWENLSAQDCVSVGLELATTSAPYVTQLILQEAHRIGSLDKIILGGQGETALAAHDAMGSFREIIKGYDQQQPTSELSAFLQQQQSWNLAGYVGMHPDNNQTTRDQREFYLVSKFASGSQQTNNKNNINDTIICNTPHEFIRGGYKEASAIWDGQRIDEFAEFLAHIGVARGEPGTATAATATPTTASAPAFSKWASGPIEGHSSNNNRKNNDKNAHEISEQQKHADEVKRQKQQAQEHRQRILRQIEDQKVERRLRLERERLTRFHVEQAALERRAAIQAALPNPAPNPTPSSHGQNLQPVVQNNQGLLDPFDSGLGNNNNEYDGDLDMFYDDGEHDVATAAAAPPMSHGHSRRPVDYSQRLFHPSRSVLRGPGTAAGEGGSAWAPREQSKLTEAQLNALGLVKKEEEEEEESTSQAHGQVNLFP